MSTFKKAEDLTLKAAANTRAAAKAVVAASSDWAGAVKLIAKAAASDPRKLAKVLELAKGAREAAKQARIAVHDSLDATQWLLVALADWDAQENAAEIEESTQFFSEQLQSKIDDAIELAVTGESNKVNRRHEDP